jgi:hypothetical protein
MALPNFFSKEVNEQIIQRINSLNHETQAKWGTMNVAQMLAHCNVTYEMAYENKHPKPNFLMKFILKSFIKNVVVSEKEYAQNSRTAPAFLITDARVFEAEKSRLIAYLQKTAELGANYFEGKESHSFGPLNKTEWNNMFYKHIDHHLKQFGV